MGMAASRGAPQTNTAAAAAPSVVPRNTGVEVWEIGATISALVQSADGYIWTAAGTGLRRFDGVRFTTFDATRVAGWPAGQVSALVTASYS